MSLKGFTKAVARLPHLVMAKSGYSTETVDPEFQDLEERFKLLDSSARKLSEDAKKFKDALSSMLSHQEVFAATLLEYKETDPTSLRAAQEFSNFGQTTREMLVPDLETIERRLVAPAADLVMLLDNVKKVITKRGHKLLDFDRHREAVKKLKEKERTVADEKSLGKAEQAFDQANREYTHINNLLKTQLPVLLALKSPFIDPCFQTLYWYQLQVHQTLARAYGDLMRNPAFDAGVSASVGFEAKVEKQAKLLDDVTLIAKNRKPVPSLSPLSPDYVAPSAVGAGGSGSGSGQHEESSSPPAYVPTGAQAQFQGKDFKQMHSSAAPYGAGATASPFDSPVEAAGKEYVTALYDFQAQAQGDLSFQRDDRIEVVEKSANPNDWWTGKLRGVVGIFPGNYVA
ncbi:hypothetical protein HDU98_008935 [Podochytrium sp. JEL0797]|nr:hypothetical protein HDU98_008935 [Podochytrium sp. JEL0797]